MPAANAKGFSPVITRIHREQKYAGKVSIGISCLYLMTVSTGMPVGTVFQPRPSGRELLAVVRAGIAFHGGTNQIRRWLIMEMWNQALCLLDHMPPMGMDYMICQETLGNGAGTGTTKCTILLRLLRIHMGRPPLILCVYIEVAAIILQVTLAELPVASIHMELTSRSDSGPLELRNEYKQYEANKALQAIGAKARLQPER